MEKNRIKKSISPRISAVVLTKNEEQNIQECLRSLRWCDEVIVIDDGSKDKTAVLAGQAGATVFTRTMHGDFAAQRNFGLNKAKGEWILFLDADECVSDELKQEIENAVSRKDVVGFWLGREDEFLGRSLKFGETAHARLIRLGKKSTGEWNRPVHEVWEIKGKVGELEGKIQHHPHPTIHQFLEDINRYTDIEARFRTRQGEPPSPVETLALPLAKFVKNYFLLLGLLDGFPGLVMAYMMSLHSLFVRVKMRRR